MSEDNDDMYICIQCDHGPCMFAIQPNAGIPLSCPIYFDTTAKWNKMEEEKTCLKPNQPS